MAAAQIDSVPRIIAWLNIERTLKGEAPVDFHSLQPSDSNTFSGQQAVAQGLASAEELHAALSDQAKARIQAAVTDWMTIETNQLAAKIPASALTTAPQPLTSEAPQLWLAPSNPEEPAAIAASVAAANMADMIVRTAIQQPALSDEEMATFGRGIRSAQAIVYALNGVQPQGPEEMQGFRILLGNAVSLAGQKAALPQAETSQYLELRMGDINRQITSMRDIAASTRAGGPQQTR